MVMPATINTTATMRPVLEPPELDGADVIGATAEDVDELSVEAGDGEVSATGALVGVAVGTGGGVVCDVGVAAGLGVEVGAAVGGGVGAGVGGLVGVGGTGVGVGGVPLTVTVPCIVL